MKSGRELDALVAEKVMGWKPPRYEDYESLRGLGISIVDIMDRERIPKPYSTDIAAAWEVVEKLSDEGWVISVSVGEHYYKPHPKVHIQIKRRTENLHEHVSADTAPHAICLAALKALGVEI